MTRRRILLVDDDSNALSALARVLRGEGVEVLTASSGSDGLLAIQRAPVDLVIADQEMPGMSGIEFLRRVREACPDTVRFMLTGQATLRLAIQAINDGAIARFLTKPCHPAELNAAIRQELQKRDLVVESRRLLHTIRRQSHILRHLEKHYPGISEVHRDKHGTIFLDESEPDCAGLLDEIRRELGGV